MFTVESQVSKVTAISSNLTPILWVSDILKAHHLSMMFRLAQHKEVIEEILPGEHYILVEPHTPEYVIKSIAWKVKAAGCHCYVHGMNLPLENLLDGIVTAKELTLMILDCAPYDAWSDGNDSNRLNLKEAYKIAEAALALLPEPEKSLELGTLRERCGTNSRDWNKLMGELEKKFKLEVERRSGVDKFTEEVKTTKSTHEQYFNTIEERVREILECGMGKKGEKATLLELALQTHTPLKDIEAIAKLQREEDETEESRDERKQHISEFLKAENKSLSLADFFPPELADPLKKWCDWLNIPESVALTAVLTTTSTLHPVGTELVIRKSLDFSVPPILYSAIVAESGQKKSPVYRTLIKKPLRVLQNEAKEVYQRQLKQYDRDLASWQKNKEGDEPTKPSLPVYYFTDATGEGIKAQAQECPDKAMFALIDELTGLFNSANQYRGGKGSDKQDMLSYYDGFGQTVLRSAGIKVDVERIYLSIFGGIQPSVLKDHLKDLKDADGQWARFLFALQPLAVSALPDDDSGIDLKDLLAGCYRRVSLVPQTEYTLSQAAFEAYKPVYNQLEQKRVSDPEQGMRAVYSKMEGGIGRLALNLHVLTSAVSGQIPAKEISEEIMQKAIALADFYIGQIKSIQMDSKAANGDLTAVQAKILNKAIANNGRITARDARRLFDKMTSTQIFEHFRELEAMGCGRIGKNKNSWFFDSTGSAGSATGSATGSEFFGETKATSIDNTSFNKELDSTGSAGSAGIDFPKKPETPLDEQSKDNSSLDEKSLDFTASTASTASKVKSIAVPLPEDWQCATASSTASSTASEIKLGSCVAPADP